MRKLKLTVYIWLGLGFATFAQSKYFESHWKSSELTLLTAKGINYSYDKKTRLHYTVLNDSENLYVTLKIDDSLLQKKILRYGLTTWIDINGKNKKSIGVKFPVSYELQEKFKAPLVLSTSIDKFHKNIWEQEKLNLFSMIELLGFEHKTSTQLIEINSKNSFEGKLLKVEDGSLLYCLSIPYNAIGVFDYSDKIIYLKLESGALVVDQARPVAVPGSKGAGRGQGMSSGNVQGRGARGGRGSINLNQDMKKQKMQEREELSIPLILNIKKVKLSGFKNE